MRRDEPRWWYAPPGPVAGLLTPLAAAYGWGARRRFRARTPFRAALPVLCIGNFTAGGTGKTPLALHVCALLAQAGETPAVLTRGYGGHIAGPHWVDPTHDTSTAVGDEPLLIARHVPTLVARDRAAGARAITAAARASVIVMDDGLQNPALEKDLTIAVVDGRRGFGNGRVIPSGPLRAPLDFQLELTDAIFVNEPADGDGRITADLRHRFTGPVLSGSAVPAEDAGWLRGARVIAFAGIGSPHRFFRLLAQLGADLVGTHPFPDHAPLTPADVATLRQAAARTGAQLVTTEKDMARLTGAEGPAAEIARMTRTLPIRLAIQAPDAERLAELVKGTLKTRRGS